jgi:hypothetical protein
MRMTLRFENGLREEAVLLKAGGDLLRVNIASHQDAVDLHRVNGKWYLEDGGAVEIEALISTPGTDVSQLLDVRPRAMGAGGTFGLD